jgi:hypothetical protein
MRRWAAVALSCLLGVLASACGRASATGAVPGAAIQPVPGNPVGAGLVGLTASSEDVAPQVHGVPLSWLDELSLYGLRTPDHLLEATLQVARFAPASRYRDTKFQQSLVNGIGGSAPRQIRVAGMVVYLTTATRQQLAIWTRGRWLFVLAIREDYAHPRALLRAALAVQP